MAKDAQFWLHAAVRTLLRRVEVLERRLGKPFEGEVVGALAAVPEPTQEREPVVIQLHKLLDVPREYAERVVAVPAQKQVEVPMIATVPTLADLPQLALAETESKQRAHPRVEARAAAALTAWARLVKLAMVDVRMAAAVDALDQNSGDEALALAPASAEESPAAGNSTKNAKQTRGQSGDEDEVDANIAMEVEETARLRTLEADRLFSDAEQHALAPPALDLADSSSSGGIFTFGAAFATLPSMVGAAPQGGVFVFSGGARSPSRRTSGGNPDDQTSGGDGLGQRHVAPSVIGYPAGGTGGFVGGDAWPYFVGAGDDLGDGSACGPSPGAFGRGVRTFAGGGGCPFAQGAGSVVAARETGGRQPECGAPRDPPYKPTEEEIVQYAEWLCLTHEECEGGEPHPDFFEMARARLASGPSAPWTLHQTAGSGRGPPP